MGVSFDDVGQKKQIATMVKSGNTMGAQKIILKELRSEFGGTAAKALDRRGEVQGRLRQPRGKEQIGTALLPTIDKLEKIFSTKVVPAVSKFLGQMQSGKGAGGQFATGCSTCRTALKKVLKVLEPIGKWLIHHLPIVLAIAAAFVVWDGHSGLRHRHGHRRRRHRHLRGHPVWLLTTPIGLVVLAIVAIIVVVVLLIKYHRQIGAFIGKVWGKIKEAVVKATSVVVGWVQAAGRP